MRIILQIAILFLALTVSSCTKDDPVSEPPFPRPPSFAGEWSDPGLPMSLNITEKDGIISGSGNLFGVFALTVRGINNYPSMTFTMSSPGYQTATFIGRLVTRDSLVGTISGSGFAANTSRMKKIK